uniref:CCHC-type domain-containing protein n=1 Tax=Tanacetum cinerariifolium TaxID=118510 RepID=A0A699HS80_TANCI|nr:hypothetical protein [Tanacetum cinerariifolium]
MTSKRNGMSAAAIEQLITQCVADAFLAYEANQNNGNGNDNGNGSHDSGGGGGRPGIRKSMLEPYLYAINSNITILDRALQIEEITRGLVIKPKIKMASKRNGMSAAAIEQLITQCVADAFLAYEANRNNGNGNNNGNGSHDSGGGGGRSLHTARKSLMKMMTEAYYPRNEIQKLENELWNITVMGTDLASYTQRFQELALLCSRMLLEETDKDEEKSNGQLCLTTTLQEAERSKGLYCWAWDKKEYAGTLPLCNKFKYHHTGPCTAKTLAYFECGKQGHYYSECPKLKNRNHGNQAGSSEARRRVYALGGGETDQDPSNIANDIDA